MSLISVSSSSVKNRPKLDLEWLYFHGRTGHTSYLVLNHSSFFQLRAQPSTLSEVSADNGRLLVLSGESPRNNALN